MDLTESNRPIFGYRIALGKPIFSDHLRETSFTVNEHTYSITSLNVGNPQCAVFANDFDFDWCKVGALIEQSRDFPSGTNVSFVRVLGRNIVDVRFWERGAGATKSSGTGSVGAAVAGIITRRVESPVTVNSNAGSMLVEWTDDVYLTGLAVLISNGSYEVE